MKHPRRCRHGRVEATETERPGGIIEREERCLDCGMRWKYKPCFVCGNLAEEDQLALADEDLRRKYLRAQGKRPK